MKFNEDSRVKIPAILHLTRLGYTYLSFKGLEWDESSNIVPFIFCQSISVINPSATSSEIEVALAHLDLLLDNEDLGKQFYEKITQTSGLKIIDFEDFNRTSKTKPRTHPTPRLATADADERAGDGGD